VEENQGVRSRALDVTVAVLFAGADPDRGRFEVLIAEAEALDDGQLDWLEAAARLMNRMPRKS